MRRSLPLLSAAVLLVACADEASTPTAPDTRFAPGSEASSLGPQESGFVPGRVLVRFAPGTDAPDVAAAVGGSVDRVLRVGVHVLSVPAGAELRIVQALARNPNVVFAEPDRIRTFGDPAAMPVDDPYVGYKWDLDNDGAIYSSTGQRLADTGRSDADMDWREAVAQVGTSASGSARIGIMDTGIRRTHQEFQGREILEFDFFDGDGDATDDNGHGTHVAGIAASSTHDGLGVPGVAFAGNVSFAIAKVCGRINRGPFGYGCPSSAIADGIVWAVDNGAHVLNLSLGGGGGSTTTRSALQHARLNGVLPFCAAGNDGGAVSYPAAWPECVAVSATDWSDGLASYSNFGSEVELAAPGGDDEHPDGYSYILSAYNDGDDGYAFLAGTSMASPQAAGLGALLHVLGTADDDAKLSLMKSTADDLGDPTLYGAGRINVLNAVTGSSGGGGGGGGGGATNVPPDASFFFTCSDLTCDFDASGSSDSDGTLVGYDWDFGDGATGSGVTASRTYAGGGSYSVTLTVTDDGEATGSSSQTVTVTAPPTGGISLTAAGYKVQGRHRVDLSWSGASSGQVDIYLNGAILVSGEANDGAYTHATSNRGGATYEYQVCEAGTGPCSNVARVIF